MKILRFWTGSVLAIGLIMIMGCSVMPQEIKDQALPQLPFDQLMAHVDQYKGQTVILGGYLVSVENLKNQTRIVAVQTPLGVGQRPKSKDFTRGRLVLTCKGFLDPEVFTKDRQITVGGRILSSSANDPHATYPYLAVEVDDIHLWPVEKIVPPDYYWYDDFWYPYPWLWRHPHWRYRDW